MAFKDMEANLKDLNPQVREKALEIAGELMEEGYTKEEAVKEAVKEAEQWYLDRQG